MKKTVLLVSMVPLIAIAFPIAVAFVGSRLAFDWLTGRWPSSD